MKTTRLYYPYIFQVLKLYDSVICLKSWSDFNWSSYLSVIIRLNLARVVFWLCFIYLLQDISKLSGLKEVHFISFMIPWCDWVVLLFVLSCLTHVAVSSWWSFCNQGSGEILLLGLLSKVPLWHDSLKVEFQENKPQCTSLYQASGCVLLTDVPWAKASFMVKSRVS